MRNVMCQSYNNHLRKQISQAGQEMILLLTFIICGVVIEQLLTKGSTKVKGLHKERERGTVHIIKPLVENTLTKTEHKPTFQSY